MCEFVRSKIKLIYLYLVRRQEWESAREAVNNMFTTARPDITPTTMNQVHCRIDTALAKLQHAEEYVCTLEIELDIRPRWKESDDEYKVFHQKTVITNYSKALDELERLVVMRLFELAKMSTSGIGK